MEILNESMLVNNFCSALSIHPANFAVAKVRRPARFDCCFPMMLDRHLEGDCMIRARSVIFASQSSSANLPQFDYS
jgi:hypothetical protein